MKLLALYTLIALLLAMAMLLSIDVRAGTSVAYKQPPTNFDYCVMEANARIAELMDLNEKLAARLVVAEKIPKPARKPKKVTAKIAEVKPAKALPDRCGSKTARWYTTKTGWRKYRCR